MGEEGKALIKNPNDSIGFCLSEYDVSELHSCISEALTIFEAFEVIYQ
jgi:hypothetical protein